MSERTVPLLVCEHKCCGHEWLRSLDAYGGRIAPTRGQCDCACHEAYVECTVHGNRIGPRQWERSTRAEEVQG